MPHAVDKDGNAEGYTEQLDPSTLTRRQWVAYEQWRAAASRGEQIDPFADVNEMRDLVRRLTAPSGRRRLDTERFLRRLREQARSDGRGEMNALTAETARDTLPSVNGANGNPPGAERQPANGANGHGPSPERGRRRAR